MTEKNTIKPGGPAFPCSLNNTNDDECNGYLGMSNVPANSKAEYSGISVRDYFAAKAITALYARNYYDYEKFSAVAYDAYRLADAMLHAREQ